MQHKVRYLIRGDIVLGAFLRSPGVHMVEKIEEVTACLLGATGSGKTTLLGSWVRCLRARYHGVSPELGISARALTKDEFERYDEVTHRILADSDDEFTDLEDDLGTLEGCSATSIHNTQEYFFKISRKNIPGLEGGRTVRLKVVDAAGEYWARTGDSGAVQALPALDEFEEQIRASTAMVVVIPLIDFDSAQWVPYVNVKLQRLLDYPGNLQRIVVAFTQYERLFIRFGTSAFQFAARVPVARFVIRRALERAPWLDELRRFEEDGSRKVRFVVTSAYGFVNGHGSPNIDPFQDGEQRFMQSGPVGNKVDHRLWRPFLTADPFIFAALDLDDSRYTPFILPFHALDVMAEPQDGGGENQDDGGGFSSAPEAHARRTESQDERNGGDRHSPPVPDDGRSKAADSDRKAASGDNKWRWRDYFER